MGGCADVLPLWTLSFQAVQMHLLQDRAVQGSIVLYRMLICV